jgi:predicted MFS family arabinose efflux permease
MRSSQLKTGYFIIEGFNSFSTVYYSYYLYFFMQKVFGFDNKSNLALAAMNGFVCMIAAWYGGRFAQRFGYFTALKLGFGLMLAAMLMGPQLHSAPAQIGVMVLLTTGMCFTWPTLEALVSEGESPASLPKMVGLYNVIWAATGALAYFSGGAMLENLGLQSMFYVPAAINLGMLVLIFSLEKAHDEFFAGLARNRVSSMASVQTTAGISAETANSQLPPDESVSGPVANHRPPSQAKLFLRLAWLANPFAYIAINTLIAVIPGIARTLELSTMFAGFTCSVWCFARMGSFLGLWLWPGWHYRFRWLLTSYVSLVGTFILILLAPNLLLLLLAQILFGAATGLIYYSSLFYSMDSSETKGEHGGIHEAAIGLGNFAGPAVGAASLHYTPHFTNSGAIAVSALLLVGLGALLAIWQQRARSES